MCQHFKGKEKKHGEFVSCPATLCQLLLKRMNDKKALKRWPSVILDVSLFDSLSPLFFPVSVEMSDKKIAVEKKMFHRI